MSLGRPYKFISTSQGPRQTSRQLQYAVRSHAATVSHKAPPPRRRRGVKLRRGEAVLEFDTNAEPSEARSQAQQSDAENEFSQATRHALSPNPASFSSSSRIVIQDPLSGQTFLPIASLPTYRKPYVPGVMDHYVHNLVIPIPELDGTTSVPLFRTTWLPWVLTDPVIFQIVVLFAATHYTTFADQSQYGNLYVELLTLKQNALSSLMRAIQSEQSGGIGQKESPSHPQGNQTAANSKDSLIAAAAKLASYEAIFGTREAFHLHMSTVARMLHEREGGFDALGMNGFLARLLLFVDTNSAFLLGTRPYLREVRRVRGLMPQHRPFSTKRFDEVDLAPSSESSEAPTIAVGGPEATMAIARAEVVNLERFIGIMAT